MNRLPAHHTDSLGVESNPINFGAISYVWGKTEYDSGIDCESRRIPITSSLSVALKRESVLSNKNGISGRTAFVSISRMFANAVIK